MTEPTLEPCPFCNSNHVKAVKSTYPTAFAVSCRDCNVTGPTLMENDHWLDCELLAAAERQWNHRPLTDSEIRETVKAEQDQQPDLSEEPPADIGEVVDKVRADVKRLVKDAVEPPNTPEPPTAQDAAAKSESQTPSSGGELDIKSLTAKLHDWMERYGLTAVPAAKKLRVSEGVIRRILTGRPGRAAIDNKVLKALDRINKGAEPIEPKSESKPTPPITAPKLSSIKNPKQAAKFFTAAVNDWIESEDIDPVTAAEMLQVNQKVFANIRLHKGGHLPHSNIITAFAKYIPAISENSGTLLAARRQLDQAASH